jgi:hypothetical protein
VLNVGYKICSRQTNKQQEVKLKSSVVKIVFCTERLEIFIFFILNLDTEIFCSWLNNFVELFIEFPFP